MRLRQFASVGLAVASFLVARAPRADGPAAPASAAPAAAASGGNAQVSNETRRAAVVAKVGSRSVTVGELEDRLAVVPRFQLRTFGATPVEAARKFLDQIVVPDLELALGAADAHVDAEIQVQHAIDRARSNATLRAVRASLGAPSAISMDEVRAYYLANQARYDTPERMNVFRILCASRDEAQHVLELAKKDGTLPTFTQLARDHSVDKATAMRGGNLGFVGPDGASNEPGLVVDAAVVKAAQALKDGEMAQAPVPEGRLFAVVWRRGTVKAAHRTVEEVAAQIRDSLWRTRKEATERGLIAKLRADKVSAVDESLLGTFDIPDDGKITAPRKRASQP